MPDGVIDDEDRELLRRAVQKVRRHLEAAEFALIDDSPTTPGHDVVWRHFTAGCETLRVGADLLSSRCMDASKNHKEEVAP